MDETIDIFMSVNFNIETILGFNSLHNDSVKNHANRKLDIERGIVLLQINNIWKKRSTNSLWRCIERAKEDTSLQLLAKFVFWFYILGFNIKMSEIDASFEKAHEGYNQSICVNGCHIGGNQISRNNGIYDGARFVKLREAAFSLEWPIRDNDEDRKHLRWCWQLVWDPRSHWQFAYSLVH